jgi:TonB family protein
MKLTRLLFVLCVLLTPNAPGARAASRVSCQSGANPAASPAQKHETDHLSPDEERQLRRDLDQAGAVPLIIEKPPDAPFVITQAHAKSVNREPRVPGGPTMINDHLVRFQLTVANATQGVLTGIGLRFQNKETDFYVYYKSIRIDRVTDGLIKIDLICMSGQISDLVVSPAGAEINESRKWGGYPHPGEALQTSPATTPPKQASPPRATPPVETETPSVNATGSSSVVDSKPRLKNAPQPVYTTRARMNRIMGIAKLRVLVGADGSVKNAKVVTTLPDFLTEEAVKAAYQMKFKPAMKAGQPVLYWLNNVQIEFLLR